jgi:TATA-box binding protein (TBP) (component of TFIID and TFIIIB)
LIISSPYKEKPVNVKLFENGSIQMTGCICMEDCIHATKILCKEFGKIKGILENNKIKPIKFVKNLDALSVSKIRDVNIVMINTIFKIGFNINRFELYKILLAKNINCTYEPCVHACVNIKYNYDNRIISIFVFESGSIIIAGARIKNHIVNAYKFIVNEIYINYNAVVKDGLYNINRNYRILTCIDDMQQILNLHLFI